MVQIKFSLLLFVLVSICTMGCDEGMQMMDPVMGDHEAKPQDVVTTVAEVKEEPAEQTAAPTEPTVTEVKEESQEELTVVEQPQEPIPADPEQTDPPEFVSRVYYSSPTRTENTRLYDTVAAGTAVYTEVVFSDDVSVVIGNNQSASPVTYPHFFWSVVCR